MVTTKRCGTTSVRGRFCVLRILCYRYVMSILSEIWTNCISSSWINVGLDQRLQYKFLRSGLQIYTCTAKFATFQVIRRYACILFTINAGVLNSHNNCLSAQINPTCDTTAIFVILKSLNYCQVHQHVSRLWNHRRGIYWPWTEFIKMFQFLFRKA